MLKRALTTLAALTAATTLAACGSSGNSGSTATDTNTPTSSASATMSASAPSASTATGSPAAAMPTGNAAPKNVSCSYPADPNSSTGGKTVHIPPGKPIAGGTVKATITTTAGDVPITLDAAKAPCTVNSFVSLATQGFFDGTACHRLTTSGIYVLQCGDPTGTGAGGPGYSFADELSGHDTYPAGTLAMANAGANTNGSQFFLCYGDCSALDSQPNYTVFGKISASGMKVLHTIAAQGTTNGSPDGTPKAHPKITGVTFS